MTQSNNQMAACQAALKSRGHLPDKMLTKEESGAKSNKWLGKLNREKRKGLARVHRSAFSQPRFLPDSYCLAGVSPAVSLIPQWPAVGRSEIHTEASLANQMIEQCVWGGLVTRHIEEGKPEAKGRKLRPHLAAVVQGVDWRPSAVVHQLRVAGGEEAQGPGVVIRFDLVPSNRVLTKEGEVLVGDGTEQAQKRELGHPNGVAVGIHIGELEAESRRT